MDVKIVLIQGDDKTEKIQSLEKEKTELQNKLAITSNKLG
jgi:hypothetical protein